MQIKLLITATRSSRANYYLELPDKIRTILVVLSLWISFSSAID
jgi:hypothetical protein